MPQTAVQGIVSKRRLLLAVQARHNSPSIIKQARVALQPDPPFSDVSVSPRGGATTRPPEGITARLASAPDTAALAAPFGATTTTRLLMVPQLT